MYDYRLPRAKTRKSKRPPVRTRTSPIPARSTEPVSFTQVLNTIIYAIGYAIAALIILAISGYFLLRLVSPLVFSLERDIVVAFVPPEPQPSSMVIVAFKPSNDSLVAAQVSTNLLADSGLDSTTVAQVSQDLQLIVDQVIVTDEYSQLSGAETIGQVLWHQLEAAPRIKWVGLDEIRWWVFNQTLSGNQRQWLSVDTPSAWQRAQVQLKLGNQFTQCSVGVINTTPTSGLAGRFSAIIERSGYPVVRLSDNQDNVSQTTVYFDAEDAECQAEAQRLGQLFTVPIAMEANQQLVDRHRAQVVIYLGSDVTD